MNRRLRTAARCSDGGGAHESRPFFDREFASDDIPVKDGILFQLAAVGHGDVAFDFSEDHDGAGLDVADDLGVFTDGEITLGVHFTHDATVDDEIVGKTEFAFDLDIAGKDVFTPGHTERRRDAGFGSDRSFLDWLLSSGVGAVVLIDDLFEHGWK